MKVREAAKKIKSLERANKAQIESPVADYRNMISESLFKERICTQLFGNGDRELLAHSLGSEGYSEHNHYPSRKFLMSIISELENDGYASVNRDKIGYETVSATKYLTDVMTANMKRMQEEKISMLPKR